MIATIEKKFINIKDTHPNCSNTPLILALKTDQHSIALKLIEAGADLTIPDKFGSSPLHFACIFRNKIIIKKLLEYGADAGYLNNYGCAPLEYYLYDISRLDYDSNILIRDNKVVTHKNQFVETARSSAILPEINEVKEHMDEAFLFRRNQRPITNEIIEMFNKRGIRPSNYTQLLENVKNSYNYLLIALRNPCAIIDGQFVDIDIENNDFIKSKIREYEIKYSTLSDIDDKASASMKMSTKIIKDREVEKSLYR